MSICTFLQVCIYLKGALYIIENKGALYIIENTIIIIVLTDLFRLRGCENMNEKYTFLLYFSMIFSKINFIIGEREKIT